MIKKIILLIIGAILLVILFAGYLFVQRSQTYFPKAPTVAERERAKELPRGKCSCWDSHDGYCHPVQDCI